VEETQQTRRLPQAPPLPKFEPAPKLMPSYLPDVPRSRGAVVPVKPNLIRHDPKTPPKGRSQSKSPAPAQPEETYIRGNQVIRVTPQTRKKQKGAEVEVMGETSASSRLVARQGNEPLGEGRPMSKTMRQRKKRMLYQLRNRFYRITLCVMIRTL
jgi:hypothetical protein